MSRRSLTVRILSAVVGLGLLGIVPAGVGAPIPPGGGKLPPPTKEELAASVEKLKKILLAFLNYESTYGHYPNNVFSKDSKPLLSWRVLLLPYLDDNALFQQFKLEEPWDSEHNKTLIGKMPKVFAPVRVKAREGETFYRGFTGKDAPFGPERGQGIKFQAMTDGTSNTGMVFEAADPVIWTKPEDLPFDLEKPLPKLGGLFDGVFHVATADGSVRRCRKDPDVIQLKAFITPSGDEVIDFDKLDAK